MSGWGCAHDVRGACQRVPGKACDPGMKGCILHGRLVFAREDKNSPAARRALAQAAGTQRRRPR